MKQTVSKYVSYIYVTDKADSTWDHSTFPHPLVILDWDSQENLIGIEVVSGIEIEEIDNDSIAQ